MRGKAKLLFPTLHVVCLFIDLLLHEDSAKSDSVFSSERENSSHMYFSYVFMRAEAKCLFPTSHVVCLLMDLLLHEDFAKSDSALHRRLQIVRICVFLVRLMRIAVKLCGHSARCLPFLVHLLHEDFAKSDTALHRRKQIVRICVFLVRLMRVAVKLFFPLGALSAFSRPPPSRRLRQVRRSTSSERANSSHMCFSCAFDAGSSKIMWPLGALSAFSRPPPARRRQVRRSVFIGESQVRRSVFIGESK